VANKFADALGITATAPTTTAAPPLWQSAWPDIQSLVPDAPYPTENQTTGGSHVDSGHSEGRSVDISPPDVQNYQKYADAIKHAHPDWSVRNEATGNGGPYRSGPNIHIDIPQGWKPTKKQPRLDKTWDGYPPVKNPDGSVSTELSITVTEPGINGGKPTNIPTIWEGKKLTPKEAIAKAAKSGIQFKSYPSIQAAVSDAQQNHGSLFGATKKTSPVGSGNKFSQALFGTPDVNAGNDKNIQAKVVGVTKRISDATNPEAASDEKLKYLQSKNIPQDVKQATINKLYGHHGPQDFEGESPGTLANVFGARKVGTKFTPVEGVERDPALDPVQIGAGMMTGIPKAIIGGLTRESAEEVVEAGAKSLRPELEPVSVKSFTTKHPDYIKTYQEIRTTARQGLQRDVNAKQAEVNQWLKAARAEEQPMTGEKLTPAGGSKYYLAKSRDNLKEAQNTLRQFDYEESAKPKPQKPTRVPKSDFMADETGKVSRKFKGTKKLTRGLPTDDSQIQSPITKFHQSGSNLLSEAWGWFKGDPITGPIYKGLDKWEAGARQTVDMAIKAHDAVNKAFNLTPLEKKRVYMLLDEPEKYSTDLLTPNEKAAYDAHLSISQPFSNFLKEKGLLTDTAFKEIRAKHLYGGDRFPSIKEFNDFMQTLPGAKPRVFESFSDAELFFSERKALYAEKGFSLEQVQKMDKQQLIANGLKEGDGRWSRMIPVYDPGLALAADIKSGMSVLNTKDLLGNFAALKEPGENGRQILFTSNPNNGNYRSMRLPNGASVWVLDKYHGLISRAVDPVSPSKVLLAIRSTLQRLEFINPVIHNLNLASEYIQSLPKKIIGAGLGPDGLQHLSYDQMRSRAIASGLPMHIVDKFSSQLAEGLDQAFKKAWPDKLKDVGGEFYYQTLWKWGDAMALSVWRTERQLYLKAGYSVEQAERMASKWASVKAGQISRKEVDDILGFTQYLTTTPKWIPSKLKQGAQGFLAPWKAWKGFSPKEQAGLAASSFTDTAIGWGMLAGTSSLMNYMFTGHGTDKNDPGHRMPWESNIQIRPHVYVTNPLFRGDTLPVRLALHPNTFFWSLSQTEGPNVDLRSDPKMFARKEIENMGGPAGTLYREGHSATGSLDDAWLELNGVYVSHALPVPTGLQEMRNEYMKTKHVRIDTPMDPIHEQILRTFRDKGDEAAKALATENNVPPDTVDHLYNRFHYPVHFYLAGIPEEDEKGVNWQERLFNKLPTDQQVELKNAFRLEEAKIAKDPNEQ
jgi:hypothetical protein